MKRTACIVALTIFIASSARAQDSMSNFRSMIENARASVTDVGGFIAPEIYGVSRYPAMPVSGGKVTIRAKVGTYYSAVASRIAKVELTYWKTGGGKTTVAMNVEDAGQGIYSAEIPGAAEGDEIFYAVSAVDDSGAAAMEVPQGADWTTLMSDAEDKDLSQGMDVRKVEASFPAENTLRLCMDLTAKPERMLGSDMAAYAIAVFGGDVRYKPDLTESELSSAWMAAYLPSFSVADIAPANELLSLISGSGGKKKRAEFMKKENRLCFSFDPSLIRADYGVGLKTVGLTIAVNTSQMAIKPMDATHPVMLYPGAHSYKIYKVE